jgi:hypothetical protein
VQTVTELEQVVAVVAVVGTVKAVLRLAGTTDHRKGASPLRYSTVMLAGMTGAPAAGPKTTPVSVAALTPEDWSTVTTLDPAAEASFTASMRPLSPVAIRTPTPCALANVAVNPQFSGFTVDGPAWLGVVIAVGVTDSVLLPSMMVSFTSRLNSDVKFA